MIISGNTKMTSYFYTKNDVGYLEFHTYVKLENFTIPSNWTATNGYGVWVAFAWGQNTDGFACYVNITLNATTDKFSCSDITINSTTYSVSADPIQNGMMEPKYTNTSYNISGTNKYLTYWSHFMRNMSDGDPADYVISNGEKLMISAVYGTTKGGVDRKKHNV